MSKRSIFGPQRRGIQINGGRKANILNSLVKKTQLSLINIDKTQLTPFTGYSFTSAQSLSTSQVNQNGSNISMQLIKNMMKQQITKSIEQRSGGEKNQQIIGIKKQIQILRQSLQVLSKSTIKVIDQKAHQLFTYFTDEMKQHQKLTINNLKKFVSVMNKQIRQDLSKQFVPNSFIQDLQKQMQQYDQRIQTIEKMPFNDNVSNRKTNNVMMPMDVQMNIQKIGKQLEGLKKSITNLVQQKNKLNTEINNINKGLIERQNKIDNMQRKNQLFNKSQQKLHTQFNKIRTEFQQTLSRIKNLQKQFIILNQNTHIHQKNTEINKNIIDKSKNQEINIQELTEQKQSDHQMQQQNSIINTPINNNNTPHLTNGTNLQLYHVDNNGYLLDQNQNFILDPQGQYILLSKQQIQILKKSQMAIQ